MLRTWWELGPEIISCTGCARVIGEIGNPKRRRRQNFPDAVDVSVDTNTNMSSTSTLKSMRHVCSRLCTPSSKDHCTGSRHQHRQQQLSIHPKVQSRPVRRALPPFCLALNNVGQRRFCGPSCPLISTTHIGIIHILHMLQTQRHAPFFLTWSTQNRGCQQVDPQ